MIKYDKKKQCGRHYKGKEKNVGKLNISEEKLQRQVNDYLSWQKIRYFHIADGVWQWLKREAIHICALLSVGTKGRNGPHNNGLGGCPDNPCFIKIGKLFNLNLMMELKSKKGQLHGKQKAWSRDLNVHKVKDPDTAIELINKFEEVAVLIEKICIEKGIEI